MRVFVAGATGAIGRYLVPSLIAAGHQVTGTSRSAAKAGQLSMAGAMPVIIDGLDRQAVLEAVTAARPDVIVHQMTALASLRNFRRFDTEFAVTAAAPASGRLSRSAMRRPRPPRPSPVVPPAYTTSWTMTRPRSRSGCPTCPRASA